MPPAPHLRDVPAYLLDPTTQEASKIVKLASALTRKIKLLSKGGSVSESHANDSIKFYSGGIVPYIY